MIEQKITPAIVRFITANAFGIDLDAMRGPSKKRDLLPARWASMLLMHEFCTRTSLGQIGIALNRDRATVQHGIRQARDMLVGCPWFRQTYGQARESIVSWQRGTPLAGVLASRAADIAKPIETPPAVKCEALEEAPADDGSGRDLADVVAMRREGIRATEKMRKILEGASSW